jgi:hypothetical protein
MAESHVITGLVAKRAELAGLIDHHRKEIERLTQSITALDTAIKLFEPDYRIRSIKPKRYQKKNSFFKNGEAGRTVLEVLRKAEKPLSTQEIAHSVMTEKCIAPEHEKPLQASLLTTLRNYQKKGLVDMTGRDRNGGCIWVLMI